MKYLGGKFYSSKWIAEEAEKFAPGLPVWEPFCGGLSVSVAFARAGRIGIASDRHPALIALYKAVADGWDPPSVLTEADYKAAKTLPDSDPLKAFAGFGCSFGGKYFGGYARGNYDNGKTRNYARITRNSLLSEVKLLVDRGWVFECRDFMETPVISGAGLLIYCDPPYQGTTGYTVGPFDHEKFWGLCKGWASGSRVMVSEYQSSHKVLSERVVNLRVTGTVGSITRGRTEKLFAVEA